MSKKDVEDKLNNLFSKIYNKDILIENQKTRGTLLKEIQDIVLYIDQGGL